jgi:hypothetical protein
MTVATNKEEFWGKFTNDIRAFIIFASRHLWLDLANQRPLLQAKFDIYGKMSLEPRVKNY